MNMRVQFSPPDISEEDIDAVADVLRSGWITSGRVGAEFEAQLRQYTGAGGVVLTSSCTAALELSLRILEIGPGDEVIVPAYTYTASAAVVDHVGARIILVDSAPDSYFPSVDSILSAVTNRTKAVILVDLAGIPFETQKLMDGLGGISSVSHSGLHSELGRPAVIVDAAHSLGAERNGMPSGAVGDFTCFSFHAVKNLTTAEGGALMWRDDLSLGGSALEGKVRRYALHGQSKDARAKMKAGSWEYDILELGYKYNMPDVLAAIGLSQLSRYPSMLEQRLEMVARYDAALPQGLTAVGHRGASFQSSAHLYMVDIGIFAPWRNQIIEFMTREGIGTNVHYKPLPMLSAYKKLGFSIKACPNAYKHYLAELTLPLHTKMSVTDVELVTDILENAVKSVEPLAT